MRLLLSFGLLAIVGSVSAVLQCYECDTQRIISQHKDCSNPKILDCPEPQPGNTIFHNPAIRDKFRREFESFESINFQFGRLATKE